MGRVRVSARYWRCRWRARASVSSLRPTPAISSAASACLNSFTSGIGSWRPLDYSHSSSLPGLTRQSIEGSEAFLMMDARVKPAHDEWKGGQHDTGSSHARAAKFCEGGAAIGTGGSDL